MNRREITAPYIRDGADPGPVGSIFLLALAGGLCFALFPVGVAGFVAVVISAGYLVWLRFLSPLSYVWVDGAVLRRTGRSHEVVVDLRDLVEARRLLIPKFGFPMIVLRDRSGARIDIPVLPQTEAVRHKIGQAVRVSKWSEPDFDVRAARDLGIL